MKKQLLLFILLLTIIASCSNRKATNVTPDDIIFIAGYEDSVNRYQFMLLKQFKFVYRINSIDDYIQKTEKSWYGKYTNSSDTLHLLFKGTIPANITPYLVKEVSGNYLIQYFTDGTKRVFLDFRARNRHLY